MTQTKNKVNIVAVITMCFIFAMISFVTNMAAPFGNIWKGAYPWAAMMGNLMNFAAYLFMGIPAGKMLLKFGYKKTTLIALATGFIGIVVQWLSSFSFVGGSAIYVYLFGAFICGFCVCMLNTVVNPMLNLLGGGGNRGNQFIQIGGTLNSLTGTVTPLLIGVLIGTVTKKTSMADVAPLLFIAMGVFVLAFLIISAVKIPEPARERSNVKYEHSPWNFRHLTLGVIAIFFYVGIEVGVPAELNLYLSDPGPNGANILLNGALIGGACYAAYFFLMLIGRTLGSLISGKVSTKVQLATVSSVGIILVLCAIFTPKSVGIKTPSFFYDPQEKTMEILVTNSVPEADAQKYLANADATLIEPYLEGIADSFDVDVKKLAEDENLAEIVADKLAKSKEVPVIPLSAVFLILCGLCTSIMWGGIFNLAVEGLGKYTEAASGIFMMMVVGGGVMPWLQELIGKGIGYMASYWLVVAMLAFLLFYALVGCKNVNKDIPVE